MKNKVWIILLSALLYGISFPFSKIILRNGVMPTMLASYTYLGAGVGLLLFILYQKLALKKEIKEPLTKKELPYIIAMVILDISAIILLMNGALRTNAANVSLLSNCEIASTTLIAFIFFKEQIPQKLWISIIMIIIAGIILTLEGLESIDFTLGSILVILAYVCWGAENNFTKKMSNRNTIEITIIKGLFSGIFSLIIGFLIGEKNPTIMWVIISMIMGFLSYGLSVSMYIKSQKYLGAAKSAAFFSIAPFIGVLLSILILGETPKINFYISLIIMIFSTFIIYKSVIKEKTRINNNILK